METIKEFLSPKSFNHLSFVVVIASVVIGIILLGVVADIETSEQRYFSCRIKGDEKDFLQRACFADYQAKTTTGIPLYGFVLLYFLLVILVCFCYSQSVRSKVKDLEREDPEIQTNQAACRLYRRYCIQLAVRFILGMTFLILQWGVFYPLNFPYEYACDLSSIHQVKHTNITSSDAANVTRSWYDCYNPQASKKTFWTIIVFMVNVLLTVLILLELIYITRKAQVDDNFREDLEFFNIHLLNKDYNVVESYVAEMKKNIKKDTKFYEPLVPNIPGEKRKLLELDNIYTNLIMHPGRAKHHFTGTRHEIFEGYMKSQEDHKSINEIEDIFAPEPRNPKERPRSIMIIGRPGIGKSLLCLKILRDWACGKLTFNEETEADKCFEFVYLFKFRHFNSDEKMNLQQLLGRGQFSSAFPNEVYNWILSHPEKVLLIFDGLDEFGKKENIVKEEEYGNILAETIPFSALYFKLVLGKLFKGATVVTTSRPTVLSYVSFLHKTFDRNLEALGFNAEEIRKYVERFCQDSLKQKIWNHIRSNANLLSLCYIPVNCHIVCFSLQERLKLKRDEVNDVDNLPTTLTEIYEDALMIIVCKHNPQYRCSFPEQEELLSSRVFAPEVEKSLKCLGEIAYKGIEENRLIFESNEVKKHEESGLLHRLPDERVGITQNKKQYCFLHLTIQELLAARYIVGQLMGRNLRACWISEHLHEGKWEVVIQFVAGMVRHKDQNSITAIFITSLPRSTSGGAGWPSFDRQKEVVIRLFKCIFEISRNSNNEWKSLVAEALSGVVNVDLCAASLTDADLTSIVFVLQEVKSIGSVDVSYNNITSIGCLEMNKLLKMSGSSNALATNECNLTTLNISGNQIGDDGLKHLSGALATNECKLTTLNISRNQFYDDGLKHLSEALATNECKLTTLNISRNQFYDDGIKYLSEALAKNECKLTTLNITGNQIGDDGVKHLSEALATNECELTTLNISGNQIGDDNRLKHLSEALATNECNLTTLNISWNLIREDGLKYLSDALTTNECNLTTLNISWNQIREDGLKYLSDALTTNECNLTTLNISFNPISDDGLKHLSDALATNECKLSTLDIRNNQIGNEGLKHLSDALTTNECQLTVLNIRGNRIGDEGLKHLSDALTTNECKLTVLNIRNNQIGDEGLKHLSDALTTNGCKLTTLNIRNNQIGEDGFKYLSDALATNECKLTTLDISDHQIGEDGFKYLSDALATNECKLTTLYINSIRIGDDRLKHLCDALTTNECKLTTLDISSNQICDDGLKHLSDALATNECKLTTLNISSNQIGDDGLKHFCDAIATNKPNLTLIT